MNTPSFGEPQPVSIAVTDGALEALRKTHGWIKFLGVVSIVGACFAGLLLLIGAITAAVGAWMGLFMMVEGVALLVVAVWYAIYWMAYANTLQRLLNDDEVTQEVLDEAMVRQRRLWVFQGVIVIVFIVTAFALVIIAAIVAPLLALHP